MEQSMEPKPLYERVSVLESRVDNMDRFFERFEEHIQDEARADVNIQLALQRVADGLDTTNVTLTKISEQSSGTADSVMRAHALWKAIGVVAVCIATVVGIWASVAQVDQWIHPDTQTTVKK
jgi:hypothetical protein